MEFIDDNLLAYCEQHSAPESDLLKDLNRQTHLKISSPRMLSGHLQGRFLSFISKLTKPNRILEIGTYTGYSALCLAEGLSTNGMLYTIDPNEETNLFASKFIRESTLAEKIKVLEGTAQAIIPTLNEQFDLVFIDADKKNYGLYYDLIFDKIKTGGIIIVDNVLWSGKILEVKKDLETQAIDNFNKKVQEDNRVENILLPIRDGLLIVKKL